MFEYMIKQPIQAYGPQTLDELYDSFRKSNFNCKALLVDVICIASMKGVQQKDL